MPMPCVCDKCPPGNTHKMIEAAGQQVARLLQPLLAGLAIRDVYERRLDRFFDGLKAEFGVGRHRMLLELTFEGSGHGPLSYCEAHQCLEDFARQAVTRALNTNGDVWKTFEKLRLRHASVREDDSDV